MKFPHSAIASLPDHSGPGVSPKFQFLDTKKVVAGFAGRLNPVNFRQTRFRTQEGRFGLHEVEFQILDPEAQLLGPGPGGDYYARPFDLRVFFSNTYDGSRSHQFNLGLRRWPSNSEVSLPIRMVPLNVDRELLQNGSQADFDRAFNQMADSLCLLASHTFYCEAVELSREEALALAEKGAAIREGGNEVFKTPAANLLLPRRKEDAGSSLWSRWVTIHENLILGGVPCSSKEGKTRALRGVTQIQKSLEIDLAMSSLLSETLASTRF